MSELIDRDLEISSWEKAEELAPDERYSVDDIIDSLMYAPSVDVVEVECKHGRWVKKYEDEKYFRHCSNCGYIKRRQNLRQTFPNFCEKCGAKMDESEVEE